MLLQGSTTTFATYAGEGPKGDNPNYYKMFNIVRYKTRNNPPQGITIPANYEEYLAQFEARNLADYVVAYQQAYAAMQAAN